MVDLKKSLVYLHALKISPKKYQDEKLTRNESNYTVFLVGQGIKIPC